MENFLDKHHRILPTYHVAKPIATILSDILSATWTNLQFWSQTNDNSS